MHNSLFIRDLLAKTNRDPLRLERRDPHRLLARDPAATPGEGAFELTGNWRVHCRAETQVAERVVEDVQDFLQHLGVSVAAQASNTIELALAADLPERACRLTCQPGYIRVEGGDTAGLWAGVAWLEGEMRWRRGPFLPVGEQTRLAAWQVQISQGPWGGNYSVPDFAPEYLSDDCFRLYAHYGVNSMMIYGDLLCYVNSAIFPELNHPDYETHIAILQEAARRAARYGVRFSYVVVGPKLRPDHPLFVRYPQAKGTGLDRGGGTVHCLCSSDPVVRAFYEETFENLFRQVPELAGVICIIAGESFYHCRMWRHTPVELQCPRCLARDTEDVISELLASVHRGATRAQPRAYVAAWPYTTAGWERPDRLELVRRLPPGVALDQPIEKDQYLPKAGYTKHIWDYSIDFIGPSDNLCQVAPLARETGHPLCIKTETGIGLEVFQYPYVPAMQRLADKWQRVRELAPTGVQQSWLFYGMFGSRAEELALWAAYAPDLSRDEFLRRMAVRDMGPETADAVLAAWEHMSRAMGHIPCITLENYYIGPSFLGPAHPLIASDDTPVPAVFDAYLFYLQELEETFSLRQIEEARTSLVMDKLPETARSVGITWEGPSDGWEIIQREYERAAAEAGLAWRRLQQAEDVVRTEPDRVHLREETLLAELIYRTFVSCAHTVRFLRARRAHEHTPAAHWHDEMVIVARAERENALAAVPIYRAAPWLDIGERTDGKFSACKDMIAAKIRLLDAFLQA